MLKSDQISLHRLAIKPEIRFNRVGNPAWRASEVIKGAPADMETMQYWETYLNDHRAGATAGTALVRRIWRSNRRTKWGPIIEKVAESIEQDLVVLDEIRAAAGVSGGDLKRAAALLTERASRLEAERPSTHLFATEPSLGVGDPHVGRPRETESVGHIAFSSAVSSRMVRVRLCRPSRNAEASNWRRWGRSTNGP